MRKNAYLVLAAAVGLAVWAGVATADNAADSKAETKPAAETKQPGEAKPAAEGSGLKVVEVSAGEPGAQNGDIVLVYYTGKLADGKVFDSTDNHGGKPFQFTLGQGRVIKGWDQGILGMKVGDKRQLTIPPDLAYGAAGSPPAIPPSATLTFDVELCGLVRVAKKE